MNEEIRLLNNDIDRLINTVRVIDAELIRTQSLYKFSPTTNIGEIILQLIKDKATVEICLLEMKLRVKEIQENECTHVDENGVDMFVETDYDSHHNYYECRLCGKEIKV